MVNIILINAIAILTVLFLISWLFVALAMYFIPLIVAHIRRHNNIVSIAILNTVLGWTFLGWLAALLWALNRDIEPNDDKNE